MNIDQFQTALKEKNIELTIEQLNQFELYYKMLVEWNEKVNLTAITEKEEVYLKHFYDSVTAAFYYPFDHSSLSICDVGAGAGFPSLPLKIVYPNLQVSIVDSLNKRITFLQELADRLHLNNVHFYHDRAETFGQNVNFREKYDIVMARAVARMTVLSEFCLPLAKVNGSFIALKGASGEEELHEAKKAIATLGGQVQNTYHFKLPIENSDRTIVHVKKIKSTPKKYPRKPGIPAKQPIS